MKRLINKHSLGLIVSVIIIVTYVSILSATTIRIHIDGLDLDTMNQSILTRVMSDLKEFALIASGVLIKGIADKKEDNVPLQS